MLGKFIERINYREDLKDIENCYLAFKNNAKDKDKCEVIIRTIHALIIDLKERGNVFE